MGCLLAIIGALSPRLLFVIIWIARPAYVDAVFDTFIFPLLGADLPSLQDVAVGAPRRAAGGDPRVGLVLDHPRRAHGPESLREPSTPSGVRVLRERVRPPDLAQIQLRRLTPRFARGQALVGIQS